MTTLEEQAAANGEQQPSESQQAQDGEQVGLFLLTVAVHTEARCLPSNAWHGGSALPNLQINERDNALPIAGLLPPAAAAACCRRLPCLVLTAPATLCNCQVITPWDVTGGADGKIDYNKLVAQVRAAPQLRSYDQQQQQQAAAAAQGRARSQGRGWFDCRPLSLCAATAIGCGTCCLRCILQLTLLVRLCMQHRQCATQLHTPDSDCPILRRNPALVERSLAARI